MNLLMSFWWKSNLSHRLQCVKEVIKVVPRLSLISKETLEKTMIEFSINSTMYKAYEGMTWEEWVNTPFNTGGYEIMDNMLSINYGDEDYDHIEVVYNYDSYETAMGTDIIVPNVVYEESSHQPD